MGSQTLEIFRQGIWASFTGGWFFDPHQEIFCNTFHMYLWLCLLLGPFVLHLTVDLSYIPTILYPLVIFVLFATIKLINHKLHILFDGEELLEDDKNKDDATSAEEDKIDKGGNKNDTAETSQNDEVEGTQDKTPTKSSDTKSTSLKDIEVDAKKEQDNISNESMTCSTPDVPDNSKNSNTNLVTTSPICSPVERAVVVDLHCTKLGFVGGEAKEKENNKEINEGCVKSSTMFPISRMDTEEDDNLIIANKPTVVSGFASDQQSDVLNIKGNKKPAGFANVSQNETQGSTDSSWGSSSECSTLSEISVEVSMDSKVKFVANGLPKESKGNDVNGTSGGKSESNLSGHGAKKKILKIDCGDKAVSLPALEVEKEDHSHKGKKHAVKPSNHVGFSLPEIEQPSTSSSPAASQNEKENKLGETSKSDPEKIMSLKENVESDLMMSNPPQALSDLFDAISARRGNLAERGLIRQRAFREGGSSRYALSNRRQRTNSGSPATSLLNQENAGNAAGGSSDAMHYAFTHEDTSPGAVHCFQDEYGQWFRYAFGDDSAQPVAHPFMVEPIRNYIPSTTPPMHRFSNASSMELDRDSFDPQMDLQSEIQDLSTYLARVYTNSNFPSGTSRAKVEEPAPKKYYMLPIIKDYSVKVSFDRLALLSLLDRNKNSFQAVLSVVLATLVAYLGYELLRRDYFYDFWLFVICFIIAKCQFSLLKSVQPDSASPIHGHNSIIVFSRSVYFCIVAILILITDEGAKLKNKSVTLYGVQLHSESSLYYAREILIGLLLAFPLIFLFGVLPQINTFIMNCLEQFDIHIFGGTAMTSLLSSIYAFGRAVMFTLVLTPLCYLPLEITERGKARGQHVLYSVFSGVLLALSYHLSRSTSSSDILWKVFQKYCCCCNSDGMSNKDAASDFDDPLPEKLMETVKTRVVHDSITCIIIAFLVFAVHVSTAFTSLQPTLSYLLYILTGVVGIVTHYLLPQLRKQLPWLFVSSPVLKSHEYKLYEWQEHSKIMWFERAYVWLMFLEKNLLYPLVCLSAITQYADQIADKFGNIMGAFVITICSIKLLRSSFTNSPRQHITLIWTVLFFNYDYKDCSETFLIDYFFMSMFVDKMMELYLKFKFILTYTAPWQITWGSAFHAFAQPFSVPHCGMLMVQAIVSTFFSAPLNPLLGSAIFITSYMRPIKFWEKDYNTKRVDHSNTRLSSHIDSNPGADDNNLNSIFYEHLTRSLQHSLCGDLALGRWGNYSSGDCFIMASDYLNALVHIIEIGNGFVTFQLRGLEFRGTYCQQREVEAINENVDDDEGCCCCQPGHVTNLLSFNAAFSQRWLAWEVVQSKYILEGYSVSDNTAITMFQMFDLRKIFITYYVTSIVFYCVRNKRLATWLGDESLMSQIEELRSSSFVDLDGVFKTVTDKDYDFNKGGVTRQSFCQNYHEWLVCCNRHRPESEQIEDDGVDSDLVTLCFALSLLGRRLLSTASNSQWNAALKSFLHGLHALFKGDFRVTATKDEWVLVDADLALLRKVVAPAVRMALKLHQDHFTCVDEFEDNNVMYDTISSHEEHFVICHEGHPSWRQAVLHNRSNLLALRYVIDDGTDDYKIIMLNKRCLNFRVIKVNKECVRGLWAGQLQELIFLRNRNPERGSIQNAKQALRNMINSSCDQPIGYPIYVSPLTTSYSETNPFYNKITIGSLNGRNIRHFFRSCYMSVYNRFAGHFRDNSGPVEIEMSVYIPGEQNVNKAGTSSSAKGPISNRSNRAGSYASIPSSSNHSTSTSSSHGESSEIAIFPYFTEGKAIIIDADRVTEALDCDLPNNLSWPSHICMLRERMNTSCWDTWFPHEGMIGDIIHEWKPGHKDKNRRSNLKKSIYLLRIDDYTVPILEDGIRVLSERTEQLNTVPLA